MTEHPDDEDFERFVEGELDEPARGEFEAHVVSCAACAARLARAARLELAMYELGAQLAGGAPATAPEPRTARPASAAPAASGAAAAVRSPTPVRRRIPAVAAAAAALGAAVLLVVGRGDAPSPTASRAIPQVICPAPWDEAACVARARVHGLVVRYPASTPPPLGTGRDDGLGHGPSTSPFAGAGAW
jgi:anti-sigma factor RsiW